MIGATVNAASRLEGLTRALGCALVASDDLVSCAKAELGGGDAAFRPLTAQAPQMDPGARAADRDLDAGSRRAGLIALAEDRGE